MKAEVIERIKQQRNFYRDNYRRALNWLLVLLSLLLLVSLGLIFIYFTQPPIRYYATSSAGVITPLIPLDKPNLSSTPLIQ